MLPQPFRHFVFNFQVMMLLMGHVNNLKNYLLLIKYNYIDYLLINKNGLVITTADVRAINA